MAVSGMNMLMKSMGIDPEALQGQIAAFGQGIQAFDKKMDLILQGQEGIRNMLFAMDGKIEALYRALDDRFPLVDPSAFPGAHEQEFNGGGFRLPVMVIEDGNGTRG
jgi:hypothetical protein